MKKLSENKIKLLLALMLLMIIALSGCGSSEEAKDSGYEKAVSTTNASESTTETKTEAKEAYTGSSSVFTASVEGASTGSSGAFSDSGEEYETSAISEKASVSTDRSELTLVEASAVEPSAVEASSAEALTEAFPEFELASDDSLSDDGPADDGAIVIDPIEDYPEVIEEPKPEILPRAGLLTSGEWNDNKNFSFFQNLLATEEGKIFAHYLNEWELTPFTQYPVKVTDSEGNPVENATVYLIEDVGNNIIYRAKTNNSGMAYLFSDLDQQTHPVSRIIVIKDELEIEAPTELSDNGVIPVILDGSRKTAKALDFMLVVDTTGSMGDEITYLQEELLDVLKRIKKDNANIDINVSVNFYRDHGDDYVVKSNPFTKDFDNAIALLNSEEAFGGGDFEEAVEEALEDAVFNHTWTEENTKICFIVLDAPPHHGSATNDSLLNTVKEASKMGIRIIPIAASGIDKDTEFLLRALAITTGGTYTFLTDDSGVGGGHITPTVGDYEVEHLNDMMVRIVNEYLK